jgi:REP element-mobilizing transposase RayT
VHHVIVRGNERRPLFFEDRDRLEYLDRLGTARRRFGFSLFAYCLMTNHAHLAIQQEQTGISTIMHWVQSTYAGSLNRRRDRVGHLFQGRFKSFLVDSERYLLTLVRYIHLNPVDARLVEHPEDYTWSSDRHIRMGRGPACLDIDALLRWLSHDRRIAAGQYLQLMGDFEGARAKFEQLPTFGSVHGDPEFAERAIRTARPERLVRDVTAERLAAAFSKTEGLTLQRLSAIGKHRSGVRLRALCAYLGRDRYGLAVAHFARVFARDESTLVRGVVALERTIGLDPDLTRRVNAAAERLERELHVLHG